MKRRRLKAPPWPPLLLLSMVVVQARDGLEPGEFVAGSFILTQKALDEAPYRYSTFLTEVKFPYD